MWYAICEQVIDDKLRGSLLFLYSVNMTAQTYIKSLDTHVQTWVTKKPSEK